MTDLGGGRGWLNDGPAQSLFRIDKALGHRMQITEAGRTWAEQNEHWLRYQRYGYPIALHPDTPSIHQKGGAIDTNEGQNHIALLASHGWKRTVYRNGKLVEPWHFEYFPGEDKYRTGSGAGSATGGLAVDGKLGPDTVRALQKAVGVAQDGEWGPATTKALQNKLIQVGYNIAADGELGPATIKALQMFLLGADKVDGQMGPATIAGIQNYLNTGGTFGLLIVDGQMGPATVKLLQQRLGVTVDGQWGPATTRAVQAYLGVPVDGELGPKTYSAIQQAIGAKVDGQMGPDTIRALQASLNAGGFMPRPTTPTTPPATAPLEVDGKWGPATIKAFQKALGVTQDGELGPNTWKAFQKATGQVQDGQLGPNTAKALQMNVGAVVDGSIGPDTIKALQVFLNAGKTFKTVTVPSGPDPVTYPKPAAPTYPDAVWWNHSPNSSPRRPGDKIQYFVVHHAADPRDLATQRDRFMKANDRNVSPNWLIGKDGSVSEIVPPDKYRAWTSGAFDYQAVTVETQNTTGDPTWGISEESHVAIAKLVAWASKRYGFPIDRTHVIGHREVPGAATACPGPSMDLDKIVKLAKEFAEPVDPKPEIPTEPETPETPDVWKIEIPKDEAVAAGKAIDEVIGLLTEIRKLYP